jgi:hypothetical protein
VETLLGLGSGKNGGGKDGARYERVGPADIHACVFVCARARTRAHGQESAFRSLTRRISSWCSSEMPTYNGAVPVVV